MKKSLILLFGSVALASCEFSLPGTLKAESLPEEPIYAFFMANYAKMDYEAPNGGAVRVDNLLYEKKEIQRDVPFLAPESDPTRLRFDFGGWYREENCLTAWDFRADTTDRSIYLYAKWDKTTEGDYTEPEYVIPDEIQREPGLTVKAILGSPVSNGAAALPTGAFKRLENQPEDVRFAINYSHSEGISLQSAVYDSGAKTISVTPSQGEPIVISLSSRTGMVVDNSTYESKAVNYETKGATYENYHVMMAGSSSMEFWSDYEACMDPIVTYNHGIGGTTVTQWTEKLAERLVVPYQPKVVAYYVGVNDIINGGKTGDETGANLLALFNKTRELLPHTQIFYVLINKLPNYLNKQPDFDLANNAAKAFASTHDWVTCVDAGESLIKPNGEPSAAYFRVDGLHMSDYGYVLWGNAIKKAIQEYLG